LHEWGGGPAAAGTAAAFGANAKKLEVGTQVISKDWADKFAREWVDSWNAHDLEKVLAHYTWDVEMSSPFIVALTG
jgi:hypothetical protein